MTAAKGFIFISPQFSVFMDCGDFEERWWASMAAEREAAELHREEESRRTRETLASLGEDRLGRRIGADAVRIPGLKRVSSELVS